ncbi:protein-glutamate O-methyltransferase CheR [Sulfurimonas sp.]|uniref:CheR family methyltransferase n=1 Tax=Sulfurimonas sp. TaxID=2022749 RepID=UPI003562D299
MISNEAFEKISSLVKTHSGINLSPTKKQLVVGRLSKRLRILNLPDYETYHNECLNSPTELQCMINTITTNETSFFREAHHFDFMRKSIIPKITKSFRVWSAAASIGAEAYSIAMDLDDVLTPLLCDWEVVATDINTEVLEQAKTGLYPIRFTDQLNEKYLKKYCLKGIGSQDGQFLIDDYLREKVKFKHANLMSPMTPEHGQFDLIFLRNMLIYFSTEEKIKIVQNVLKHLKPNGYIFIGHAESIEQSIFNVKQIKPTIYKKGL